MAYKIYQKLQSGMANQGLLDAADVDVMEDGQRVTLAEKLSGLSEDVAGMAEDVSDAVAVADGIKTAQGQEVGDVAETDIAEGVLIWHGGKLYRVLSLIAAGDRWQDMDVAETTVSEEINAMRGVSTEGVYLTITPASAIPVEGVKARIYNEASQTYLPEVTFTSASPRHLLGQIAYGDVYTIIMPSIDGYTQPADQTFKAGQMLRQRTVEYMPVGYTDEHVTIRLVKSDSASVEASTIVVKQYDEQGNLSSTTNLTTVDGVATIDIPLGTKYSITAPTLSGFAQTTPNPINTASFSERDIRINYIVLSSGFFWVMNDGSYLSGETDPSTLDWNDIAGVATNLSQLYYNNGNYNFIIPKAYLTSFQWGVWISPGVQIPSMPYVNTAPRPNDDYNGPGNTANVKDFVEQQAAEGNTYTSMLKTAYDTTVTIAGTTRRCFIPGFNQFMYFRTNLETTIRNIMSDFLGVTMFGTSAIAASCQANATQNCAVSASGGNSNVNKDNSSNKFVFCIELI